MPTHPKFRFLTMEEFSKLSRTEKITYLERAIAQVLANKENAPEYILFIERRARPRKLPTGRK